MKKRIFISYSHKDETWKNLLVKHLNVLEDHLEVWDDMQIQAGDEWGTEIVSAMEDAHATILLVSADLLTSGFIKSVEIPALLQRRAREKMKIFPLILRPCLWDEIAWLKSMQIRPKNAVPLSTLTDSAVETSLVAFAREIKNILNQKSQQESMKDKSEQARTRPLENRGTFDQEYVASVEIPIDVAPDGTKTIPLALGLETVGEKFFKMMKEGSEIPQSYNEIFTTSEDAQSTVEVHILIGFSVLVTDCLSVGKFQFSGIPLAPKGVPDIRVEFNIDTDGVLRVQAIDKETGNKLKVKASEIKKIAMETVKHLQMELAKEQTQPQTKDGSILYELSLTREDVLSGKQLQIEIPRDEKCPKCNGRGEKFLLSCQDCGGKGILSKVVSLKVDVPKGVKDGNKLRLPGAGNFSIATMSRGDMYIKIHLI